MLMLRATRNDSLSSLMISLLIASRCLKKINFDNLAERNTIPTAFVQLKLKDDNMYQTKTKNFL